VISPVAGVGPWVNVALGSAVDSPPWRSESTASQRRTEEARGDRSGTRIKLVMARGRALGGNQAVGDV
jgi:hypothetical protein